MHSDTQTAAKWHARRMKSERLFRFYGQLALGLAVLLLVLLLGSLIARGYQGFVQYQLRMPLTFDTALLGLDEGAGVDKLTPSASMRLVKASLRSGTDDPDLLRETSALVSTNAGVSVRDQLRENPQWLGQSHEVWVPLSSSADLFFKGSIKAKTAESDRALNDRQIAQLEQWRASGAVRGAFNISFFTRGDSRAPEKAGFLGAVTGSLLTLAVCLAVVFPLGVMTAVYLQEFAKPSRWVDIIEVNINNLAAVPSIVFGLLGLAVYINLLGMPRSSALVGGMTLALMILPVIIITTRTSLGSIPNAIRDAARGVGATPLQVVWHHVLPLAMPGIMTGTILGMARAIGETAPLLMIGMVAFVADIPSGFTSSATVMPVQIYLWASSPEAGFSEKTAAGILVLLMLLLALNALAITLRKRFEIRW